MAVRCLLLCLNTNKSDDVQVQVFSKPSKNSSSKSTNDKENAVLDTASVPHDKTEKDIQDEIQAIFRQITASVTFLPQLDGNCTFNVLVYAEQDSEVPVEWGDSDSKEIKDGEKVQLRGFSTSNHKVDTVVSYRYVVLPPSDTPTANKFQTCRIKKDDDICSLRRLDRS